MGVAGDVGSLREAEDVGSSDPSTPSKGLLTCMFGLRLIAEACYLMTSQPASHVLQGRIRCSEKATLLSTPSTAQQ